VFFVCAMRRVDCPNCGVVVEQAPWGDGKCQLTTAYRWFLAGWAMTRNNRRSASKALGEVDTPDGQARVTSQHPDQRLIIG